MIKTNLINGIVVGLDDNTTCRINTVAVEDGHLYISCTSADGMFFGGNLTDFREATGPEAERFVLDEGEYADKDDGSAE